MFLHIQKVNHFCVLVEFHVQDLIHNKNHRLIVFKRVIALKIKSFCYILDMKLMPYKNNRLFDIYIYIYSSINSILGRIKKEKKIPKIELIDA